MIANLQNDSVDSLLAVDEGYGRIPWGTGDAGGTDVDPYATKGGLLGANPGSLGAPVVTRDPTDPPFTSGGGGFRMGGGSILPLDTNPMTIQGLPKLQLQNSDNNGGTTGSSDAFGQGGDAPGGGIDPVPSNGGMVLGFPTPLGGGGPRVQPWTDILGPSTTGRPVDVPPATPLTRDLTLLRTDTLSPYPGTRARGAPRATVDRAAAQPLAARPDDVTSTTPINASAAAPKNALPANWKLIAGVAAGAIVVALLLAHHS